MNLAILGIVSDLIGVFILTLVAIIDYPHQRIFNQDRWWKKYWWMGWRPFYRDTQTLEWKRELNRRVIVYHLVPPRQQWILIGFLFILVGFSLQLIFYLKS